MKHLNIDLETYSSVNLKTAGLYRYVQSPDFEILLFGYSVDFGPVQVADFAGGESLPAEIWLALSDPDVIKHAYNAPFEIACLNRYGQTPAEQWRCTMFHGLYCGYTAGLAATAKAAGLPEDKRKSSTGSALIRTFCVPVKPTRTNGMRTRIRPGHEPEKWKLFKEYCRQDVAVEMELQRRLSAFPVPDHLQEQWVLDQRINARGVGVDRALADGAVWCSTKVEEELMQEAHEISGINPNSGAQLKKWLEDETEEDVENVQKATVAAMLKTTDDEKVRRMLEIRQEVSKASVKKFTAVQEVAGSDGRVRGLLQFYGANRTGRWAGRLVQMQNLTKNSMDDALLDLTRQMVKDQNLTGLKLLFGNVPDTLSQLVRTSFVPSPENRLYVADFSAIEARVIAWLAGEKWRQDVFATHGKIYEASASAMFGVPMETIVKGHENYALRQKGKVAELALGYQGGPGSLISMGALKMGLSEEELPDIVRRWRASSRRIVDLWYAVENAALSVLRTGQPAGVKGLILAWEGDHETEQDFLTIALPSGRKLFYAHPHLAPNRFGRDSIHYWGTLQGRWKELDTYGGKLVENITQAIARDCLAESITRLEQAGYHPVMHVHDEVICDDPPGLDIDHICRIMGEPLPWAPGLILKAEGFAADYYRKD